MSYSRYKRGATGSPGQLLPLSSGQIANDASGSAALAQAVGNIAQDLYKVEQQAEEVELNRMLAQFQIQDEQVLAELDQLPLDQRGVDDMYAESFKARRESFVGGVRSNRMKRQAEAHLDNYYLRSQVSAQKKERARIQAGVVNSIGQEMSTWENIVRSHPTRANEAAASIQESLLKAEGLIAPEMIEDIRRTADTKVQYAAASAMVEQNPYEAKRVLHSGKHDANLTPEMKNRLLAQADIEIRRIESEAKAEQRIIARQAAQEVNRIAGEIAAGYPPSLDNAYELTELSGEEGRELQTLLDKWARHDTKLQELAQSKPAERYATLDLLERKRINGEATPEEIEFLEVAMGIEARDQKAMATDGVRVAVRRRIITEPVEVDFSNPVSIQEAEVQAGLIRETLGRNSSVLTPATQTAAVDILRNGAEGDRMGLFKTIQETPLIKDQLVDAVADADTPQAHAMAAAVGHNDPVTFAAITRGLEMERAGIKPDIPEEKATRRMAYQHYLPLVEAGMRAETLNAVVDASAYYIHGLKGGVGEKLTITSSDLSAAVADVLPGHIIDDRLVTHSKEMTPSRYRDLINHLQTQPQWYRMLEFEHPGSGIRVEVTTPPKYADGKPVPVDLLADTDNLRMISPGVFRVHGVHGPIMDEHGRALIFDIRNY